MTDLLEESLPEKKYRVRQTLLNESESKFFQVLTKRLPREFHTFPKMRIADILETLDGDGYYFNRNKILPKHIDFVIVDENFKPLVAIEIDGSSHTQIDRIKRDTEVNKIFKSVGMKLERISVDSDFEIEAVRIKSAIMNL